MASKKRIAIWNKSKGYCWYCGCDIPLGSRWHADHMEPVIRELTRVENPARSMYSHKYVCKGGMHKSENNTIDNMVPACAPCNNFKHTFSIEDFRSELEAQIDRARKSSVNFRNCERFGLIEIKPSKVVFWFEKNKPCAVKDGRCQSTGHCQELGSCNPLTQADIDDLQRLERLKCSP